MNIIQYLFYLQEGYILSDKTISINLNEFENKNKNKLLITGLGGSAKTSLSEYLSKKYNTSICSDSYKDILNELQNKSNKRIIIEGMQIFVIYKEHPKLRQVILDQPMIIMGMSAIKAGYRADKRDGTVPGKVKNWKDTYIFVRKNITYYQKLLNKFRNDAIKIPNAKIKEYKVPEFEPVYY